MLKVIYSQNGKPYSDFNLIYIAERIIQLYKNNEIKEIEVSTSNIIHALRVLGMRNKIQYNDICFIFNDEVIMLNEKFELNKYPKGFIDCEKHLFREIVEFQMNKIKK